MDYWIGPQSSVLPYYLSASTGTCVTKLTYVRITELHTV